MTYALAMVMLARQTPNQTGQSLSVLRVDGGGIVATVELKLVERTDGEMRGGVYDARDRHFLLLSTTKDRAFLDSFYHAGTLVSSSTLPGGKNYSLPFWTREGLGIIVATKPFQYVRVDPITPWLEHYVLDSGTWILKSSYRSLKEMAGNQVKSDKLLGGVVSRAFDAPEADLLYGLPGDRSHYPTKFIFPETGAWLAAGGAWIIGLGKGDTVIWEPKPDDRNSFKQLDISKRELGSTDWPIFSGWPSGTSLVVNLRKRNSKPEGFKALLVKPEGKRLIAEPLGKGLALGPILEIDMHEK